MKIRELTIPEWRDILHSKPASTFFELPEWYQIWADYLKTQTSAFLIDEDILISLIKLKGAKGLIVFRNSGPAGTYSNLQSLSGQSLDFRKIKAIIKSLNVTQIRLSPLHFTEIEHSDEADQSTQIIKLSKLNSPTSMWSRNHIRQLDKALHAGFEIKVASQEEWKSYYELYQAFISLKGPDASNQYRASLFESLAALAPDQCQLWIAKEADQTVAGRIVFYQAEHVVEWHAVSQTQAAKRGVNQLLIHDILQDAIHRGKMIYDFNPSGGHQSVEEFKSKFGAEKLLCPVIKQHRVLQQIYMKYTYR